MNEKNKPLIGILTAQKANGAIAGNGQLFKNLQQKLISLGGISFVFTIEDIEENCINGYLYFPEKKGWIKKQFPYPDLVYNRIPFRKTEQQEKIRSFFFSLKKRGIPFFNPCFINKYEFYECFKHHTHINKYLPETILIRKKQDLLELLETHSTIYLKPANSSRGKGIYRLSMTASSSIQVEGRKTQEIFETVNHFWNKWHEKLLQKTYLAQEAVQSAEYNGSRFDFRILAHADGNNYTVTGVGIRQSQEQEITTHIPSGGKLLPYELVKSTKHEEFIQSILSPIGRTLSEHFGFFGEFSIDAGISKKGQYYIYEVNSKPMSFDEQEIEAGKIDNLCRLFLELSKNDI
ncbi:YheC/YheD family endospore coat-associated protein [Neobacillus kokaensis]|uniref:ATP-grasp domain-containing protein n=1 Tax=Neobacillus kokaensis TaxID=2759023 RepID=A0ABQ3N387_9BACI|nr:YheC/YheD family protein [Neobacillus kokaensis]GHH98569.1 hypothetical protein AM1BK_21120 [Neobacillus kokaensis]